MHHVNTILVETGLPLADVRLCDIRTIVPQGTAHTSCGVITVRSSSATIDLQFRETLLIYSAVARADYDALNCHARLRLAFVQPSREPRHDSH